MNTQRLSPFHRELLHYLKRESEEKTIDEGYILESDPDLQEFEKLLEGAFEQEGELPLTEILEHYQHLFEKRGPLHIEKKLLGAFSKEEMQRLGLPRIYRGLPRLYRADFPAESRIKKSFTHLPSLLSQMLEKAISKLYLSALPRANGKLVLFTWIMADGSGDFSMSKEVLEMLERAFPETAIEWIALVPKGYVHAASIPNPIFYEEEGVIDEKTVQKMKEADLVLQFPTYYPDTEKLVQRIGHTRFFSLGEYGFSESKHFDPRSKNRAMGLHFLEKGILLPSPKKGELESPLLKKWMCKDNRFALCYLNSVPGLIVYLHALLKSLEEDTLPIDLCMPDLSYLIAYIQERGKEPLLEENFGVGSIDIYFGGKVHSHKLAKKGKKLRILSPPSLSPSDFQTLLSQSTDLIAVRGNHSFSEAILLGKPFFYDGRHHARYFLKDLLALAENRLKSTPNALTCIRSIFKTYLHNLPAQEGTWVDETYFQEKEPLLDIARAFGSTLKQPDTLLGFQKLSQIIQEEHSLAEFLIPYIQRSFAHRKHPELAAFEKRQLDLFISGNLTATDLLGILEERLR